jgi:hypothetical protein
VDGRLSSSFFVLVRLTVFSNPEMRLREILRQSPVDGDRFLIIFNVAFFRRYRPEIPADRYRPHLQQKIFHQAVFQGMGNNN